MRNRTPRLLLSLVLCTLLVSTATGTDPELHPKKGACLSTRRHADWAEKVQALNVGWLYTWGWQKPQGMPEGVEFVPMVWGLRKGSVDNPQMQERIAYIKQLGEEGAVTHVLGFNEPDGKKQANLTVAQCIEAWPALESIDLRLGSPAPVHAHKEWMLDFMEQADDRDYRVDFVCVHWYGGTSADGFINRLKEIHDLYDRPIWITEFAPADWRAKTVEENRLTQKKVMDFMKEVLPRLDRLDFVERYAWFSSQPDSAALGPSTLFNEDGSLTELGQFYAEHRMK